MGTIRHMISVALICVIIFQKVRDRQTYGRNQGFDRPLKMIDDFFYIVCFVVLVFACVVLSHSIDTEGESKP